MIIELFEAKLTPKKIIEAGTFRMLPRFSDEAVKEGLRQVLADRLGGDIKISYFNMVRGELMTSWFYVHASLLFPVGTPIRLGLDPDGFYGEMDADEAAESIKSEFADSKKLNLEVIKNLKNDLRNFDRKRKSEMLYADIQSELMDLLRIWQPDEYKSRLSEAKISIDDLILADRYDLLKSLPMDKVREAFRRTTIELWKKYGLDDAYVDFTTSSLSRGILHVEIHITDDTNDKRVEIILKGDEYEVGAYEDYDRHIYHLDDAVAAAAMIMHIFRTRKVEDL